MKGQYVTLKEEKKRATKIARQLCYGPEVIMDIRAANSVDEISRILRTARNRKN